MPYFCCPVCGEKLKKDAGVLRCINRHSFDVAAEGYAHLLPANRMHSKMPGDDKAMVAARRSFLDSGGYGLFADKLAQLAAEYTAGQKAPVILDAGCGEGYYTGKMAAQLPQARVAGFDISKAAVRAAAKRYKTCEFAVASIFSIPAADGSANCLTDVFAPAVPDEFARVLAPGGCLIYAVPGPRHLFGMKEILYEHPYENEVRETEYPGFVFEKRYPVCATLHLADPALIKALFSMTPYYWNTPKEGAARLAAAAQLTTEIEFDFLVYRRK